ncbi:MAG: phage integrase N-terminal SAM-like domain-containing protein, partial [Desulfobacterales bacterium]|nr:phage integrase N-terminal SAM-like domain-containing protein [Desulfobacterales bacterium]
MASKNGTILHPPQDKPLQDDASTPAANQTTKPNRSEERQRFWQAFKTCLEENRVPPDRSPYYVRWAKEFVPFLPEKRLKSRSAEDIRAFLAALSQREEIADWKVRQAEYALRMLYEAFLPTYSPGRHASAEPSKAPLDNKGSKAGGFRDRVLPGEVERKFPAAVERFRTELRTRHYSYRTETSYLEWIRRFIAFHDYADPERINPAVAVKEYLEYLALKREVSASTQNQALNALVFFYGQVLKIAIGEMGEFARAKRPQRLPEVLTRDEVETLF